MGRDELGGTFEDELFGTTIKYGSYTLTQMLQRGETVDIGRIWIRKVCDKCYDKVGSRMRSDDPHLINVFNGVVHGYGEWADRTACGRNCTGPTWWHRF